MFDFWEIISSIKKVLVKINKIKNKIKNRFGSDFFELIKHGKNYISADLFTKGLAFISIPIFTRLLVPEEYGILAIFLSFIAVFTIISGLGVRGAVTRYYYEKSNDFNEYFSSNLFFVLGWNILLSLFLFVFKDIFITFFKIPLNVYYLGIGAVFFSTTFSIYRAYLQASKQSEKIARLSVLNAFLMLILAVSITFMLDQNRYYGKIIAQIIVGFCLFIYSLISILKISKINLKYKYIKYSLLFGIPLVFHNLSGYILNTFDQIIINQISGAKDTGLYSFAYKIGMLQQIITWAILKAWTPIFYQKLNENKFIEIENLAKKYITIVLALALFLIYFSKDIIFLIADEQYYTALSIVPIIIIGYLFNFAYVLYVNYAFYLKKTSSIAIFTFIAGSINVGLNYLLIPKYGYQIAAWTTLISFIIFFILHFINVKFILKFKNVIRLKVLFIRFLNFIFFITLFYFIKGYTQSYILFFFIKCSLLTGFLYLSFKKILYGKN